MGEIQSIEALSGSEIIEDVLNQIRIKMLTSCDLRDTDSYGQGYSGEIKISLKLYSMDVLPAEFFVPIAAKTEPPASTEQVIVNPVEIEETVQIEQELDLEAVRDRMKETPEPAPVDEAEESRMPQRLKRKYTRRNILETTPMGGAVDLDSLPEGE